MTDETRTLIDAAAEHLPKAVIFGDDCYPRFRAMVTPAGQKMTVEDMERFGDAPARIRETATFETPKAFTDYIKDFAAPNTRVFAALDAKKVVAHLDYHATPDKPSWSTHKAIYPAVFDQSFGAWASVHGKPLGQKEFAEFLEDRAEDAINPTPADLMEVALKFEAIRNVDFKSAINLSSNERQFRYEEKDSVGGSVAAPKIIALRTPVFYGSDPVEWRARFSYAITGGSLFFTVKIHRLDEVLDKEFQRLTDAIAVDLPGIPVHRGKA